MSTSILQVRGIGPFTATILAEHGITTAEELAAQAVPQVASIRTFSEIRAVQVINAAKTLLEATPVAPVDEAGSAEKEDDKKKATPGEKQKKEKAPKKKSKKDTKTGKKKKSDKADKKGKKSDKHKKKKKSGKKSKKKKK